MPQQVVQDMVAWCNKGNPSASYKSAVDARQMIAEFGNYIAALSGVVPARDGGGGKDAFRIIFTASASEANATMIRGVVDSWFEHRSTTPHLVVSAIEHKSIVLLVEDLVSRGRATVSWVAPTPSGHITAAAVAHEIGPRTALVAVMAANNETGALMDIAAIGRACHEANVPFYTDSVQVYGKSPVRPGRDIDGFCISFHKLHGPPGTGALVVRDEFARAWCLPPLIYGTQNSGWRGGTENVPGLGASFRALRLTMIDRAAKNARLRHLRGALIAGLQRLTPVVITYPQYLAAATAPSQRRYMGPSIVLLGGYSDEYLPNTVLLSVLLTPPNVAVAATAQTVCNAKFKERLAERGIIVSIGSACNTSSAKASHVLDAMGADAAIRAGTLRISLGDYNTERDVAVFLREFAAIFASLS